MAPGAARRRRRVTAAVPAPDFGSGAGPPAGPSATEALIDLLRRDPAAGWPELLERLDGKLRVVLHFRMSPRLRARCDEDDLLQELWLEAARKLDSFEYRGPGSLLRWLAGILRNKLLHAGRSLDKVPLPGSALAPPPRAGTDATRPPSGLMEALAHTQPGVSWPARRAELRGRVQRVLGALPPEQREAILMKLYEGLSGREAARLAGVDESTISLRFKKGLAACARRLREPES